METDTDREACGIAGATIGRKRILTRARSSAGFGPIGVVIPKPLFASRGTCLATASAYGATSFAHVAMVGASSCASEDARRQAPSRRVSTKSFAENVRVRTMFKTNALETPGSRGLCE